MFCVTFLMAGFEESHTFIELFILSHIKHLEKSVSEKPNNFPQFSNCAFSLRSYCDTMCALYLATNRIHTHTHIYTCNICIYMYICICIYVHECICIYTHICI